MSAAPHRILVVSDDDVCAAPLVAAVLRTGLEGRAVDVAVTSAGTEAQLGEPACALAVAKLPDHRGLEGHRSVPINADLVRRADLVLVMDRAQRALVNRIAPGRQRSVFTLREAASLARGETTDSRNGAETLAEFAASLHRRRGLVAPGRVAVPRRGLLRRPVATIDVDDLLEGHRLDDETHGWALVQARTASTRLVAALRSRLVVREHAA